MAKEYVERGALNVAIHDSWQRNPHNNQIARQTHNHEHRHFLGLLHQQPAADVVEVVKNIKNEGGVVRETFIICGFSGIGKTTAEQKNRGIVDFESSAFSHKFENGFFVERNELFPRNYVDALCERIDRGTETHFLVSCHKEVRDELKRRNLDYIIVLPTKEQKNEYMKRWLKRGSSTDFITAMCKRWDDMIQSCEEDDAPKIYLSSGEHISDLICY
jgi:hypothetical protein